MRPSSTFALGYLAVSIVQFFVDMIRGAFEILFWVLRVLFGVAVAGADLGRRERFRRDMEVGVQPYLAVLADKRAKMFRVDDYGVLRPEKWAQELNYFIHEVMIPQTGLSAGYVTRNLRDVVNDLDDIISAWQVPETLPSRPAFGHRS